MNEYTLQWRHNEDDDVSNHQPHGFLLNGLFRRRSKLTSKLRVTGLCAGNSPVTGEFPAQKASNAENVSNWWRHHDIIEYITPSDQSGPYLCVRINSGLRPMRSESPVEISEMTSVNDCKILYFLIQVLDTELLTHCGRDKIADIFQMTFSNDFCELKSMNFD